MSIVGAPSKREAAACPVWEADPAGIGVKHEPVQSVVALLLGGSLVLSRCWMIVARRQRHRRDQQADSGGE